MIVLYPSLPLVLVPLYFMYANTFVDTLSLTEDDCGTKDCRSSATKKVYTWHDVDFIRRETLPKACIFLEESWENLNHQTTITLSS